MVGGGTFKEIERERVVVTENSSGGEGGFG